jgi:regulator of sigma E protease
MIGQLLLGISILVGLHELGHLLTAKLFGMRVEKFSIGFPPKIWGVQWGETEYSVGALPLGGYVKIAGMIDESMDTKHLSAEPEPYEFRAKPAWQRLIVMVGGVTINVITGVIMFIFIVYTWGQSYLPTDEGNKHGIVAHELAQSIGLKTGDKIIKINGKPFEHFDEVRGRETLLGSNSYYTVLRTGKEIDIKIPNDMVERLSTKNKKGETTPFIQVRSKFEINEVAKGSPAAKAGLQKDDKIVTVNGNSIEYYHEFEAERDKLTKTSDGKTKATAVPIEIERKGETKKMVVDVGEDGKFGFYPKLDLDYKQVYFSFSESITKGTADAFGSVGDNIKGMGKIFRGEVSVMALSGPVGIAQVYGTEWDWRRFWFLTALLSMWLAFLNILPIPALDGGHVVFLLYEMVSGRKPSDKFLERSQVVGMVLLLGLMVFVFGLDIFKTVRDMLW